MLMFRTLDDTEISGKFARYVIYTLVVYITYNMAIEICLIYIPEPEGEGIYCISGIAYACFELEGG